MSDILEDKIDKNGYFREAPSNPSIAAFDVIGYINYSSSMLRIIQYLSSKAIGYQ